MLGKDKLNTIKVLISKALINSYITHGKFVLVDDVLREYNKMQEEIKYYMEYIKAMEIYCVSWKENTAKRKFKCKKN